MTLSFPTLEFDDAVASVCHGSATEAEMRALNELLRSNPHARDEYLLRIGSFDEFELFSRALSASEIRELYAKGKPDP